MHEVRRLGTTLAGWYDEVLAHHAIGVSNGPPYQSAEPSRREGQARRPRAATSPTTAFARCCVAALGGRPRRQQGSRYNKQGWRYRIDREGPAQSGTAAQFRLQFVAATYAGIHVELNRNFGARFLRDALTQSYNAGQTVYVHMV